MPTTVTLAPPTGEGRTDGRRVPREAACPVVVASITATAPLSPPTPETRLSSGVSSLPSEGRRPRHREVVARDELSRDAFRPFSVGKGHTPAPYPAGSGQIGERRLVVTQELVSRIRDDRSLAAGSATIDLHELPRILDRQRPEEDGVDEAEHGGVGANPDGEGQHGDRREPRAVPTSTHRVPNVLQRLVDPSRASQIPARLLDGLDASELRPCPPSRLLFVHATALKSAIIHSR